MLSVFIVLLAFSPFIKSFMRQKPYLKLMPPKKAGELELRSPHKTEGFNYWK